MILVGQPIKYRAVEVCFFLRKPTKNSEAGEKFKKEKGRGNMHKKVGQRGEQTLGR